MAYGALIYGYVASTRDIINMPEVDSYKDNSGRTILIDTEDISPAEWAMSHHKYGEYVYVEDETEWYSDKVIFGIFLGESGDELDFMEMMDVKTRSKEIAEVVKFFTDQDTDINDYGYHIVTIYD